jgi:hypothetical protein
MNQVLLNHVTAFKSAMKAGLDGLCQAAHVYVKMLDTNPELEQAFKDECHGFVPAGSWHKLEQVGRGKLHPRLMLGGFKSAAKSHAVSQLPYSEQVAAVDENKVYEIVTDEGEVKKCTIEQAPITAVRRLVKGGKIQPIAKQRQAVKQEHQARMEVTRDYLLTNNRTTFKVLRPTSFTKKQLEGILSQML